MTSASFQPNPVLSSVPVGAWNVPPFQIITLLDMLPFDAHLFFFVNSVFDAFTCEIRLAASERGDESVMTAQEKARAQIRLAGINTYAERIGLRRTVECVGDIETELLTNPTPPLQVLLRDFDQLRRAITRDLRDQTFLSLAVADIGYYQQEQLFGPEVFANFENTRTDVTEAGNCYALGRYTACVFHSMRVTEKGLHSLVRDLNNRFGAGVVFNKDIEYINWGNIIDKIEAEIARLLHPSRQPRLAPGDLRFYSETAKEFVYFKVAWRDDVSHSRSEYDQPTARSVMDHVKAFMTYLAEQGLTE